MIMANKESTLMVMPTLEAKMNIPRKATGKPKATQNANLVFKNNERKIKTNTIPIAAFSANSRVLWSNVTEASLTTLSLRFGYF